MKLNLTISSSYRERHFNKKPRRRAAERAVGHPIPSSCESRFPRLRNVRVAGVQFLILAYRAYRMRATAGVTVHKGEPVQSVHGSLRRLSTGAPIKRRRFPCLALQKACVLSHF